MIDTNKVQMMTRLAAYEKNEGIRDKKINRCGRTTYLIAKELESVVCISLAYAGLVGTYIACRVVQAAMDASIPDFTGMERIGVIGYLVVICCTMVFTRIRAVKRYRRMRRNLIAYDRQLGELRKYIMQSENEKENERQRMIEKGDM